MVTVKLRSGYAREKMSPVPIKKKKEYKRDERAIPSRLGALCRPSAEWLREFQRVSSGESDEKNEAFPVERSLARRHDNAGHLAPTDRQPPAC